MPSERLERLVRAADRLSIELDQPSWLVAVGIGKMNGADCIYVYTKGTLKPKELARLNDGWDGFPVVVKKSGQFTPLTSERLTAEREAILRKRAWLASGWLPIEQWGPKCAGCGAEEYRIDGYCSIECRNRHCDDYEDLADLFAEIDALRAEVERLRRPKMFPLQTSRNTPPGPMSIPWSIAEQAYGGYVRLHGKGQSLERLAERGGFSWWEIDDLYPAWREEVRELTAERRRADELAGALVDVMQHVYAQNDYTTRDHELYYAAVDRANSALAAHRAARQAGGTPTPAAPEPRG